MTLKWLLHVLITQLSLKPSPPSICHPLGNLCSNLSYSLSWGIPLYSEAPYWQLLFLHTCSTAHPLQLSHMNFSETVTHSHSSRFTPLEELCFTARDRGLDSSVTLSNSPASKPPHSTVPTPLVFCLQAFNFPPLACAEIFLPVFTVRWIYSYSLNTDPIPSSGGSLLGPRAHHPLCSGWCSSV